MAVATKLKRTRQQRHFTYNSVTRTKLESAVVKSLNARRLGWSSCFSTCTSLSTSSCLLFLFFITLTAHTSCVLFSSHLYTTPNFPLQLERARESISHQLLSMPMYSTYFMLKPTQDQQQILTLLPLPKFRNFLARRKARFVSETWLCVIEKLVEM